MCLRRDIQLWLVILRFEQTIGRIHGAGHVSETAYWMLCCLNGQYVSKSCTPNFPFACNATVFINSDCFGVSCSVLENLDLWLLLNIMILVGISLLWCSVHQKKKKIHLTHWTETSPSRNHDPVDNPDTDQVLICHLSKLGCVCVNEFFLIMETKWLS